MEPDLPYRPADHAVNARKALSAWLVYAMFLVAALGLPSLWAQVMHGSQAAVTAHAPAPHGTMASWLCKIQERLARSFDKDRFG